MAKLAECRVCGKPYKICINCGRSGSGYNWRRVACSPECGDIYLQRIIESRQEKPDEEALQENKKEEKVEIKEETPVIKTEPEKEKAPSKKTASKKTFSPKNIFEADKTYY